MSIYDAIFTFYKKKKKKNSLFSHSMSSSFFFQGRQWSRLSKEVLKAPSHALTAPQAKAKEIIGISYFLLLCYPLG